jgi:hypothetical protein
MSKIFKRPMFRRGGSASEGIMSMANPRTNYQKGGIGADIMEKYPELGAGYQKFYDLYSDVAQQDMGQARSDILSNLLIRGGLGLVSGEGAGKGTLGAIATAFKKPTEQALGDLATLKQSPAQARMLGAKTAIEAKIQKDLQKMKNEQVKTYESGTPYSRFKTYLDADVKAAQADPSIKFNKDVAVTKNWAIVGLEDKGLVKNYKGEMKDSAGNTIPDEVIESNNDVPEGAIFFDPSQKIMKQKIKNPDGTFTLTPI